MRGILEQHPANTGNVDISFRYLEPMRYVDPENRGLYKRHTVSNPLTNTMVYHDTHLEAALNIAHGDGFKGSRTPIGDGEYANFSWWTLDLGLDDRQSLWSDICGKAKPSPFMKRSESRYGNFRYRFCLSDLLDDYTDLMGCRDFFFRRLGTFIYTREVMYAIAVVPRGKCPNKNLAKFPSIPTETFHMSKASPVALYNDYEAGRGLRWRVQSAHIYNHETKTPTRWDTVALAFFIPENGPNLMEDNNSLKKNLRFIKTADIIASKNHDQISVTKARKKFYQQY